MNYYNDPNEKFKYKRKHEQGRDVFEIINEILDEPKKYKIKPKESGGKSSFALALSNAKIILSADFPELKFRSRSESYSGGCSFSLTAVSFKEKLKTTPEINELYLDILNNRMREIEYLFKAGTFNGSNDSYEYTSDPLKQKFHEIYGDVTYASVQLDRDFYNQYEENNRKNYEEKLKNTNIPSSSNNSNKMKF